VHQYEKYEEDETYYWVGDWDIYPIGQEYAPKTIGKLGLPVKFAKDGGITAMETAPLVGETITWAVPPDDPGDNIPTTITVSGERVGTDSIRFIIENEEFHPKATHDENDYVLYQETDPYNSESPRYTSVRYRVMAYISPVPEYDGIDCSHARSVNLANNNYFYLDDQSLAQYTYFTDFEFYEYSDPSGTKAAGIIQRPGFKWGDEEIRVKLSLIMVCKMPHRSSRPIYIKRRECTVIIPAA
jgi:hypothetical protein